MSDDKPLHVRVAEALGHGPFSWLGHNSGWCKPFSCGPMLYPLSYDTDWSATGPLIERFKLLVFESERYVAADNSTVPCWVAASGFCGNWGDHWIDDSFDTVETGDTLLIAVCNLILVLHAAGKLRA